MREIAVVETGLVDQNVGVCVAEGDDVFGYGDKGGCFEEGVCLQWCCRAMSGKSAGVQEKWLGHTSGATLRREAKAYLKTDIRKNGEVSLNAETRGSRTASVVSWKCIVKFNSGFCETKWTLR